MANVINRTTLRYLESVNTPDYPESDWVVDPDMSQVEGVPRQYWKAPADWSTSGPVPMTQAERDAVDQSTRDAARNARAAELDDIEGLMRAFALVMLDEINALRANAGLSERTATQLKSDVRTKMGT